MPYIMPQPNKLSINSVSVAYLSYFYPASGLVLIHATTQTVDANNQPTAYFQLQIYSANKGAWELITNYNWHILPSDGSKVRLQNTYNSTTNLTLRYTILPATIVVYSNATTPNPLPKGIWLICNNTNIITAGYAGAFVINIGGNGFYTFMVISDGTIVPSSTTYNIDAIQAIPLPNGGF